MAAATAAGAASHQNFDARWEAMIPLLETTIRRYADAWNVGGDVERVRAKDEVLRRRCDEVGRDIGEIEFTLGIKATIRDSPSLPTHAEAMAYELSRQVASVQTPVYADRFKVGR